MKRLIEKIIIMLIIMVLSIEILSAQQVIATSTNTAEINISISEKYASLGDTITVTIIVNGTGVSGVQGTLSYDHNVLEYSSKSMKLSNWRCSGYNDSTGVFLTEVNDISSSDDYISGEVELIAFTFNVKSDAASGNTTFNISNMVAVNNTLSTKSVSTNITILSGSSIEETIYMDSNTTLGDLQTDTSKTVELYDNSKQQITETTSNIGTGMQIKISENSTVLSIYNVVIIGDITGDGTITNADLQKLVNYNIELESLEGLYLLACDINSDGTYANDIDILKLSRILSGEESL